MNTMFNQTEKFPNNLGTLAFINTNRHLPDNHQKAIQ